MRWEPPAGGAAAPARPPLRGAWEGITKPSRERVFEGNTFWQELFPSRTVWFRAEIEAQRFARLPVGALQLLAEGHGAVNLCFCALCPRGILVPYPVLHRLGHGAHSRPVPMGELAPADMKPRSADPASEPRALQVKASSTLSACIAITVLYGHTDATPGITRPTPWLALFVIHGEGDASSFSTCTAANRAQACAWLAGSFVVPGHRFQIVSFDCFEKFAGRTTRLHASKPSAELPQLQGCPKVPIICCRNVFQAAE